jgi:two-component system, NtrC family, nitrogen regulation response regulator NtrX
VSPRVLIVDDEPALRRTLARVLESLQYEALTAGDPHLAYSMLDEADVDLVLLDLHLPTMSGALLYLALVRRWPRLRGRIILMTGDPSLLEDAWPPELLECPLLLKPFTLSLLAETVRLALLDAEGGGQRASNGPA